MTAICPAKRIPKNQALARPAEQNVKIRREGGRRTYERGLHRRRRRNGQRARRRFRRRRAIAWLREAADRALAGSRARSSSSRRPTSGARSPPPFARRWRLRASPRPPSPASALTPPARWSRSMPMALRCRSGRAAIRRATSSPGWIIAPSRRPPPSTAAATMRCAGSAAPSRRKCRRPSCCGSPGTRRAAIRQAGHFLDLADFLTFRATGSLARSACTVACKWNYLAHAGGWPVEFFASVGLGDARRRRLRAHRRRDRRAGRARSGGDCAPQAATRLRLAGRRSGRRRADRRPRRRARHARRAAWRPSPPIRFVAWRWCSAPRPAAWRLADEARFVARVWGPHYSALTPGQWLVEGRPDRPSGAQSTG